MVRTSLVAKAGQLSAADSTQPPGHSQSTPRNLQHAPLSGTLHRKLRNAHDKLCNLVFRIRLLDS
eukprot:15461362-Alexandrium_andersonii.AAC.1